MEYFVIGDEDTVLGFRYAGVEGRVVGSADEARSVLEERAAGEPGIVIITEDVAEVIRDTVNRVRFESAMPVIVEVPGPAGPAPDRPELIGLIREALGIRV
ncbi:MAG: V-type ATP synthase subunit F [bacterium]